MADCDLEWIKYDGGRLPSGAIQGGITEKGEPLYIGRACHEDSLTNGKVQSLEEVIKLEVVMLCWRHCKVLI